MNPGHFLGYGRYTLVVKRMVFAQPFYQLRRACGHYRFTLPVSRKCYIHTETYQKKPQPLTISEAELTSVKTEHGSLKLAFSDGSTGEAPFLWLRDNCQCSSCYDSVALARKFLLKDLQLNIKPETVQLRDNVVTVHWNDGHISTYNSSWFYNRSFNNRSRKSYRNIYKLDREPWGSGLSLDKFDYSDLKSDDSCLLQWLVTLERKGVALIRNAPDDPEAAANLLDHVAFLRNTHYGRRSPVIVREDANNLAFSSVELGLHNDLPFYEHQPGLIVIQTVKQHKGTGGESVISDGLLCSDILRRRHPEAFRILSQTNIYFWDKGSANVDFEMDQFFKISNLPVIGLDNEGHLEVVRLNNQVRDTHLDLSPDEVNNFYEAMTLFNNILYDNSYTFKMADGEILCLDNVRCLHGREAYDPTSSRHLETSYFDWDEARCKRRRLQEKLSLIIL